MKCDSDGKISIANVGTALGFRDQDWILIKKHSGLWDPIGRL